MPKPMRGYWGYLLFILALAFIVIGIVGLVGMGDDTSRMYQYIGGIAAGVLYVAAFFILPKPLERARMKKFAKMMQKMQQNQNGGK